NGHVFVTGRIKDVIIVRGRNYYPQDIENVIEGCHPALRPASGAAFAVEEGGEPRLVIAWELEREHRNCDGEAVAGAVRQAVADSCELETHAVVLVRPASIPKTSSGKIQRNECQRAYLAGELEV